MQSLDRSCNENAAGPQTYPCDSEQNVDQILKIIFRLVTGWAMLVIYCAGKEVD